MVNLEKISALEGHIGQLSDENTKIVAALRAKRDQISSEVTRQLHEKDQIIVDLTDKLRGSIKAI